MVDEGGLGEADCVCCVILSDRDTNTKRGITGIRDLPSRFELCPKLQEGKAGASHHEEVINVDCHDDNVVAKVMVIYAVNTFEALKLPGYHLEMKVLIPDSPALFHSI